MTNSKHTPGPWWQNEDENEEVIEIFIPKEIGWRVIARLGVGFYEEIDTEQRANAVLIQHAPDLLEVAERILAEGKINIAFEPWRSLAEAVKKARGEI